MVVGFRTTYAINAYHHGCEFESRSGRGIQHHVIKFVSVLQHVSGFLLVLLFPPPITEILLKVSLSTIKQTKLIGFDISLPRYHLPMGFDF